MSFGTEKESATDFQRTFRPGLQEFLAIALSYYPRVQDDHYTPVVSAANEPTKALLETQNGLGELIIHKGIASGSADPLHPGLGQRLIRDGKGQLGDDDIRKGWSLDVHTLPETHSTKQDTVNVLAKGV